MTKHLTRLRRGLFMGRSLDRAIRRNRLIAAVLARELETTLSRP